MTVRGKHHSATVVILTKHWEANREKDTVTITCPCCGQKTTYDNKAEVFDTHVRDCQGGVFTTTRCTCLIKQRVYPEDYYVREGTGWE